jgi:hypothetical protein
MNPKYVLAAWLSLPLMAVASGCSSSYADPDPNMATVATIRKAGEGAATTQAAAPTGTGWGGLKGQFVFQGTPPTPGVLATGGKDGAVCDAAPIPDQTLLVDSASRGIGNVVVFARKVSRINDSFAATANEEKVFDQKGCYFLTHVMGVRTGQPVRIKNSDPIGHNTNISPPADTSINPLLPGGGDLVHSFKRAQAEPVSVTCNIHPWMKAWILPRTDPYFAVTDKEGRFELKDVPAGEEIEFQVWHEKAPGGLVAGPVQAKGRFKVTIPADGETDLGTIEVPAAAFQ